MNLVGSVVHQSPHLFWALGLIALTIVAMMMLQNHVIRRRLVFSITLWMFMVAVHIAILNVQPIAQYVRYAEIFELFLFSLAALNALVTVAFNRWQQDHARDRTPAIVQDSAVLFLFALVVAVTFRNHADWLTGGAVAGAVLGFALQETLGNAFAGIAIQIEKPFKVGHWITVGDFEGLVTEVTWRATKIKTKAGNLVIVPNNVMAREAINNYSEPAAPTRLQIEVGATYSATPNDVKAAMLSAIKQSPLLLQTPAPEILLVDFGGSAITYRARFWINDYSQDERAKDSVRSAIFYEFKRRNIEIPWPIQIQYERDEPAADSPERRADFARTIAKVPVLASLSPELHRALANASEEKLFADGEDIVREGEPGSSMFLVRVGRVGISVGLGAGAEKEVAVTEAGGYFGEMSLLTGQPRTATVTAHGDCTVLEISADTFRTYVKENPEIIDQLAKAAAERRRTIDSTRATAVVAPHVEQGTLAKLMRNFFGLD